MFRPTRAAAGDYKLPFLISNTIRDTNGTRRPREEGNTDELDELPACQRDVKSGVGSDPSSNLTGISGRKIELV
jgi:hypothetical protein